MDEKRVILVQNHPFLPVHLESWAKSTLKEWAALISALPCSLSARGLPIRIRRTRAEAQRR